MEDLFSKENSEFYRTYLGTFMFVTVANVEMKS
jgi:hypothetical protein